MALTKRKLEFLKVLIKLYEKNNNPVHYMDVAEAIGVSKWTAYDILNELEKLGYVQREYYVSAEKTQGRSLLMYVPDKSAYDFFDADYANEWDSIKKDLFNSLKRFDGKKTLGNIMKEISHNDKPLNFCAYILTTLMLNIKILDLVSINNVRNSLLMVSPDSSLIFFTGVVMGILLNHRFKDDIQKIIEIVGIFHENVKKLNTDEKQLLNNFLTESLKEVSNPV
ncbi:MAG: helix-turn-helix domain-containing protein [Thermoanaerobacteraceae bacterium]|nr:helix-turn-helix domain-containing protein [Thermoanaerobacteraceae bacterium]